MKKLEKLLFRHANRSIIAFTMFAFVSFTVFQSQQRDFAAEGLHYHSEKHHRLYDRYENSKNNHYGSQGEEREGETSGYASDSVEVPVSAKGSESMC